MNAVKFLGYELETTCRKKIDGRYSVKVMISKKLDSKVYRNHFTDPKISLVLPIEAEKESINFGKNLIQKNLVGF